ncbi:MAG: hypothetical protein ACTSPQ_14875 [Candidatus Helarchaeota archaeon]
MSERAFGLAPVNRDVMWLYMICLIEIELVNYRNNFIFELWKVFYIKQKAF